MSNNWFEFKHFTIYQNNCGMRVSTDSVLLGAWALGGNRILDIGTGTGIIALLMAQRFPNALVNGIDIDPEACLQATENAKKSPFHNRISIAHTPVQHFHTNEPFDCIVSNPPYFVNSLRNPNIQRSIARHTDSLPFNQLCKDAYRLLSNNGTFHVIIPTNVTEPFIASATIEGLFLQRKHCIKTIENKPEKRCLLTFCKHQPTALEQQTHWLFDAKGNKSAWFLALTNDIYR